MHSHPSPNNGSSPHPKLSTTTAPPGPGGGGGGGSSRLNTGASTFFPRKITIKSQDGREVDFGAWRKNNAPASPVVENNAAPLIHQTHQRRKSVNRVETAEEKENRLAEEKENRLVEEKEKENARVTEEEKKVAEERKRKEEGEKQKIEEQKKEEAERKKEEEEEAERERIRKDEEKESIRKEGGARIRPTSTRGLTDDEDSTVRYSRRTTTIPEDNGDVTDGSEGVTLTPPESPLRVCDGDHRILPPSATNFARYPPLSPQVGVSGMVVENDRTPEQVRRSPLQKHIYSC